jgi:hypothetical protein
VLATNEHHLEKEFGEYHLHQMINRLLSQELIYLELDHKRNAREHITEKRKFRINQMKKFTCDGDGKS